MRQREDEDRTRQLLELLDEVHVLTGQSYVELLKDVTLPDTGEVAPIVAGEAALGV
jgi:hypothetical protein